MQTIDAARFARMAETALKRLKDRSSEINALNVFPVPDGDTGTNMTLTLEAGVTELQRAAEAHLGRALTAFSRGLLMGARGNSGVILSQLFCGFAQACQDRVDLDAFGLAQALEAGVQTAYQAVLEPVEGTVLTVAREAASRAMAIAPGADSVVAVMAEALEAARAALRQTPELLPTLKRVGVVDAGGQGLVCVYEGFLDALRGEGARVQAEALSKAGAGAPTPADVPVSPRPAQAHFRTEEIAYGYCTEVLIALDPAKASAFREDAFRQALSPYGDSLLVVADEKLVKVHLHTETPGTVLNLAQAYGELLRVKIENMREQHAHLLREANVAPSADRAGDPAEPGATDKAYGIVAVAAGEGIARLFRGLGVDVVVEGGQTMNPSAAAIAEAIRRTGARQVIVLPNNGNVVLAAQQAATLVDVPTVVVATRSIPQGLAAMVAFDPDRSLDENRTAMLDAAAAVKTGLVTTAVRDSVSGGVAIRQGDYLGIAEGSIVAAGSELLSIVRRLMEALIDPDASLVTVLAGAGVDDQTVEDVVSAIAAAWPELEVEAHRGGQPVYSFIFSVE